MQPIDETKLSDEQSRLISAQIREELARRRISRQLLADRAKISISTLEKALSGRRPLALGVSLRNNHAPEPEGVAPDSLGYYSRRAVAWIEGVYLTLRPSFGDKDAIYAYRTEISWDTRSSNLVFKESERLDAAFTQQGAVSVPNPSGHIYLVTNVHGQYRLIIVARPTISGEMYGILTTLQVGRGAQLTPVAAPIALIPLRGLKDVLFGRVGPDNACYPLYRKYLKRTVDEPFALFLPG
jgi:transcriptional regulator with XRE-family HTH domain